MEKQTGILERIEGILQESNYVSDIVGHLKTLQDCVGLLVPPYGNFRARQAAAFKLRHVFTYGDRDLALQALTAALTDSHWRVRYEAYMSVGELTAIIPVELVAKGFEDDYEEVVIAAIESAGKFPSAVAPKDRLHQIAFLPIHGEEFETSSDEESEIETEDIEFDLEDEPEESYHSSRVRAAAIRALAQLQAMEYTASVIKVISEKDEDVQLAAIESAGLLKLTAAIRPICDIVTGSSRTARILSTCMRSLTLIVKILPVGERASLGLILSSFDVGMWYNDSEVQDAAIMGYYEAFVAQDQWRNYVRMRFYQETPQFMVWEVPSIMLWLGRFRYTRGISVLLTRTFIRLDN